MILVSSDYVRLGIARASWRIRMIMAFTHRYEFSEDKSKDGVLGTIEQGANTAANDPMPFGGIESRQPSHGSRG